MMRVLRASLPCAAALAFVSQAAAQTPTTVSANAPISEALAVPVFPGHMIEATLTLPTFDEPPYPAVLVLTVREPGAALAPTAAAVIEALLERGVAVVRLDVPPRQADVPADAEPLDQPADDAYAVLQFVRAREDVDGDRVGILGVGSAADHAARAAALDEAARALVLLGVEPAASDTLGLPTGLPLLSLPLEVRAAPAGGAQATPITDAAAFLTRQLQ